MLKYYKLVILSKSSFIKYNSGGTIKLIVYNHFFAYLLVQKLAINIAFKLN